MNTLTNTTKASPTLVVGELFHTAPRTMSTLFGVVAAAVVTAAVAGLI